MANEGYMVTIGGCPIVFTSPGIGSITSTSELPLTHPDFLSYASAISLDSIANAALDVKNLAPWTEEVDLLEGTLDVSSLSFKIHDILMTYNGDVRNIASYLFTRDNLYSEKVISVFSNPPADGPNEGTIILDSTIFISPTSNFFWVQGECFSVEEWPSTAQITFNSRGLFNSYKKENHNVYFDPEQNEFAEMFFEYPGIYNQELLLWRRDSNGNWIVLWRGICNRAPRSTQNGAAIEIQADSFVNHFNKSKFYHRQTNAKLVGFDSRRMCFKAAKSDEAYSNGWFYSNKNLYTASSTNFLDGEMIFFKPNHTKAIRKVIHDGNIAFGDLGRIVFTADTGRPTFSQDENQALILSNVAKPNFFIRACMRTVQTLQGKSFQGTDERDIGSEKYIANIENPGDECFQVFRQNISDPAFVQDFTVMSIPLQRKTLPVNSGSIAYCYRRHVFEAEIPSDNAIDESLPNFLDSFSDPQFTVTEGTGDRIIRAYGGTYNENFYSRAGTQIDKTIGVITGSFIKVYQKDITKIEDRNLHVVQKQIVFKSFTSLESNHWMDLYRHGLVFNNFETRNFDFGFNGFLSIKLLNPSRKTQILLDGAMQIGEIVNNFTKYYGIYQTTGFEGRIRWMKPEKPTNATVTTASLSAVNLVDKPRWEYNSDKFVTTIRVKSEGLPGGELILNNNQSKGKFGEGKTVEIELANLGIERTFFLNSRDPIAEITAQLYDTYFDILNAPTMNIEFSTTLEYINTIFPGSYVTLSEWLLPTGAGTRGLTSKKVLIISRTIDLTNGKIDFKAIKFQDIQQFGISPCVKIASISGNTLTLDSNFIDSGESDSPTDYAASNLLNYTNTPNDRGIGYFAPSQKVQLILRNTGNYSVFNATVASVGTTTITLSETVVTSPVDWPAQALNGNVDLRFSDYETSGILMTQKTWAYIGDGDTGLLNGTIRNQKLF